MKTPTLQQVLDAAKRHGKESEPDHEVADLQDLLWACFAKMPNDLAATVLEDWIDFVSEWGPQ